MNYPETRMLFYAQWYDSMTIEDKNSYIGNWVKERISLYNDAIEHETLQHSNPLRRGGETMGI